MAGDDSSGKSPVDSEVEKGEWEKEREEHRDDNNGQKGELEAARPGQPDPTLLEEGNGAAPAPATSRTSKRSATPSAQRGGHDATSTAPFPPLPLAQEQEKDFTVTFAPDDSDPLSPRNKSTPRKWSIVLILSSSALCVTCASALYTSTYEQLMPELDISRLVATLGLSLFVCGLGLGPMFLSPLSEFYGRRPVYVAAFGLYLIWLVPCALARNLATMLVARFLDGLAGSAFLSVAGGTVGDMFPKDKLSLPMMVYTASPFVGPEVG